MEQMINDIDTRWNNLKKEVEKFEQHPSKEVKSILTNGIDELQQLLNELHEQLEQVEVTERKEQTGKVVGEYVAQSSDLRHLINLNDSFRFSRRFFGGDISELTNLLDTLKTMSSFDEASDFFFSKVEGVQKEDETVLDFFELLKKYYN